MMLAGLASAAYAGDNLLSYGEFAQDDLKQWIMNSRQRPLKPFVIKDGILTGRSVPAMPVNNFVALSRDVPALEKNAVYEFGGKIRLNVTDAKDKLFRLAIREVNAQGRSLRYYDIKPILTANGQWIEVKANFTARPMVAKHQLYVVMQNFAAGEQVDMDYVFVRKAAAVPAATDGNLVKNGDFEAGFGGWIYNSDPQCRSTSLAFDEKQGKVLRVTGDITNRTNKFRNVYQALPVLEKGKTYTLSYAMRGDFKSGAKMRFGVYVREINNKQRTVRYVGKAITATQAEWKTFEYTFSSAKNAVGAQIYITCENMGNEDVAMVDNIKLTVK